MLYMDTKNFPRHEFGTTFNNGDQVDVQNAGSPNRISLDELERQRRREAFERQALGVISPEQRPLSPAERLGQLHTRGLRLNHIGKYERGELDKATQ
jgi:hypothetical protein